MTTISLIFVLLIACFLATAIVEAIDCFVKGWKKGIKKWKERRIEATSVYMEPLTWSDKHQSVLPLFVGMSDELAVSSIDYSSNDGKVVVHLHLYWWARPRSLYRSRLEEKVKRLLEETGHERLDQ